MGCHLCTSAFLVSQLRLRKCRKGKGAAAVFILVGGVESDCHPGYGGIVIALTVACKLRRWEVEWLLQQV